MVAADFDAVMPLPFAAVGVRMRDAAIAEIAFLPLDAPARKPVSTVAALACEQILAYVEDPAHCIDLPLRIEGTEFQCRVWNAIACIPSGATRTYADLARDVGSTARAVGQACGDNRLPLAIPCHRVVASRGLGGFAHRTNGAMLDVKRWLLGHEGRPVFALVP